MSKTPVFDETLKYHDHDLWTAAPTVFPWPNTIELDETTIESGEIK